MPSQGTNHQQLTKDMEANNFIRLSFLDSEMPEFKEVHGEDFVRFGQDNKYPLFLTKIYNKSSKHAAIINGKVSYIFGGGIKAETETPANLEFIKANSDCFKKAITDIENYGGFYLQVIPNLLGTAYHIFHITFEKIRSNKTNTKFFYKENWLDRSEEKKVFPAYTKGTRKASIYSFKEYRAGGGVYAMPSWYAACNFIEADIEVSKHTLTNAKSGFSGSKLITFKNGVPPPEGKREITKQFRNEFGGSTAEKIVIQFLKPGEEPATIDDLGSSDLTKEDFTQVDNLITSNIFAAHSVTHPLLFGIQQAGKLGSGSELRTAYDIFKNTYVQNKQKQIEDIINEFAKVNGVTEKLSLICVDPISIDISEATLQANLTKTEIRAMLGFDKLDETLGNQAVVNAINSLSPLVANKVLESMTANEIRSLAGLAPAAGGTGLPTDAVAPIPGVVAPDGMVNEVAVNDNIKNLTAKQHQQLLRIIRQFTKGQITKEVATVLLKTGLGLNDADIASILGTDTTFSKALRFDAVMTYDDFSEAFNDDESVAMVFAAFGESKEGYTAVLSRTATFATDEEKAIVSDISNLDKIKNVAKKFEVRYSYEKRSDADGPVLLSTSRLFCKKLIGLDKFYKREDIQKISAVLGYDVFKRTGGFWNNDGIVEYHCRHEFKSHVVIKK